MFDYECCICKQTVSASSGAPLDPCALLLIANYEQPREQQKDQQFFCHFECFRRLVNNDGVMYIMDSDFPTVGEIELEEGTPPED